MGDDLLPLLTYRRGFDAYPYWA